VLESHVKVLSDEIGIRRIDYYNMLDKAAEYITDMFRRYGYNPYSQEYTVAGSVVRNIIAVKAGTGETKEKIVIGAHYDTAYSPGADDNASGVAVLLELARLLSPYSNSFDIEFVAFVNEEGPYFKTNLMGSMVYARAAARNNIKIKTAIILEMVGYYSDTPDSQTVPKQFEGLYPNTGNFIAAIGRVRWERLLKQFVDSYEKSSSLSIKPFIIEKQPFVQGVDASDHWSFWQYNYPAFMLTDTAFLRNKNYHAMSDVYTTLDYKYMAEAVKGIIQGILSLAQ